MASLDPNLAELVAEAHSIAGWQVPWYVHEKDGQKCLVFNFQADDAVISNRLKHELFALCDARGYRRRFLIARSTTPRFVRQDQVQIPDYLPE